jgi:LPPG:FO 2-phospho-L-lactate transferase
VSGAAERVGAGVVVGSPGHTAVVALCGGVGGAKLADGLARVVPAGELSIIVNTADDFRHLGLWISPDIDSVLYALAGLADPVRGWGRRDETWSFMAALRQLQAPDWFQLGDADLAMHIERTWRLAQGETLSAVTARLSRALGIAARVLPMSDDRVSTRLLTDEGWLDFQEYFVHRQCRPRVQHIEFVGAAQAHPGGAVLAALRREDLRAIVICPSNPFVSIEPILALPGVRDALRDRAAPALAVTPIIAGRAIKGPAAKMLVELGLEVSGVSVARRYAGLIDAFVIDEADPPPAQALPGIPLSRAQTLMQTPSDRERLAQTLLAQADALRVGPGRRSDR